MKKLFSFVTISLISFTIFAQVPESTIRQIVQSKTNDSKIDVVITSQHTTAQTGITHIYLRQRINGQEIFNSNSSLHLNKQHQVVQFHNNLVKDAAQKTNTASAKVSATQAAQLVATTMAIALPQTFGKTERITETGEVILSETSPLTAKAYYLNVNNELRLVWNIEIYDNETHDWWHVRVDALSGEILEKNNWTSHCDVNEMHDKLAKPTYFNTTSIVAAAQKLQLAKKTTEGTYNVLAFPSESPNHGPILMTAGTPTSNASPYGWHDTDGVAGPDFTITRGNNVYASDDTAARNIPGFSPDGGASLEFNYPYSVNASASANRAAAITNLFYANNYIHDVFYNYGFDEVAGNFQANNYGKGGLQRDAVRADAQDGSGTNNANFQTPVDGVIPRMQMFLWNPSGTALNQNLRIVNGPNAGIKTAPFGSFTPKPVDTLTAYLAIADSGSNLGCPVNVDLTGRIAVITRGGTGCTYTNKVLNAQARGAVAVIIVNTSNSTLSMTGTPTGINIPAVMVTSLVGNALIANIKTDTAVQAQLFLSAATLQYDSDFDNGVIVHEYGHGISNRLAGGPANSSCLTGQEQAGEGWSDFFALCLTARPADTLVDGRGIGTWVNNQNVNAVGIRNSKYSRDMGVNPVTYNSIKTLSVPHGVGSVWCSMLYDIYWDMVDKYGFNEDIYDNLNGGNNITLQLVMDALKLQPCGAGFVDLRQSIILADSIRYGGANKELLWRAFARRGLGLSANQGLSSSRSDGVEAFDLPQFSTNTGLINTKAWEIAKVLPNPAQDNVQLALPDYVTEINVSLVDITGKQLLNTQVPVTGGKATLSVASIQRGLYIIKLSDGSHSFQTKLLLTE